MKKKSGWGGRELAVFPLKKGQKKARGEAKMDYHYQKKNHQTKAWNEKGPKSLGRSGG